MGNRSDTHERRAEFLIASLCLRLFTMAERVRVPVVLDRASARVGCSCIRIYQKWLSARTGRRCLFRVSCSSYASKCLREYGWVRGVSLGAKRLQRCGGAFSLSRSVDGQTSMVAADGTLIHHEELADWLLRNG